MQQFGAVAAGVVGCLVVLAAAGWLVRRNRRDLGTPAERAAYETLHRASLVAPPLRAGLTANGAAKAVRHLRALLGANAVAMADERALLAWEGTDEQHAARVLDRAAPVLENGTPVVLGAGQLACGDSTCPIRHAVLVPLTADERVVGVLAAFAAGASAGLVRAVTEVGRWVSTQLDLAELDRSRMRLAEAEVRALRAQISPHFIYNSLNAIASFVRTDPERARELLTEFADFTRYSFRTHGDFTTLAEELRSVERYLLLERARFGDRLRVTLRIAPEVLPVAVPFLCLQPIVENAVRHGLQPKADGGVVTIVADDVGTDCVISIEDDGIGMDPDLALRLLSGEAQASSTGLANVDERLRQVFGDDYGLQVETAPEAGTKVSLRVPKYHAGVHANA
ncbi:MAG: histidine kinase [Streptosporangiales bacterium]|nr:histidine kinase [Streptosporangiales bacterium]MBO0892497.1 histidine kinase [Acidothermales bacterium]